MHDGSLRTLQRFVGAFDQLLTALHQHLNGDVVGNEVFFDQLAYEVEVGLAGGREANFDFLETHLDQRVEHPPLALRVHWVDECLIAVAQVDAAPNRRTLVHLVGPGAVVQHDRHQAFVFVEGHLFRFYGFGWHVVSFRRSVRWVRKSKKPRPFRLGLEGKREYVALALHKKQEATVRAHWQQSAQRSHRCQRAPHFSRE